jgi:SNF2 family DNA or RNA helicase
MSVPFTPRPYQLAAIKLMCSKPGAALFLDPGMGKTSSTLATFLLLKEHGEMTAALVIAPIRPCRNVWPEEVAKWADFNGLQCSLVLGSEKSRLAALTRSADIYLMNPENTVWLLETLQKGLVPFRPDVLAVDESTKYKSATAKRFKALRALLPRFRRRYILTGTPAPQSLQDLWSQMAILDNGQRLGRSLTAFRHRYYTEIPQRGGYSLWELNTGSDQKIFSAIADIAMRLDAKDHLQMPDRIDNPIVVDLPKEALNEYRKMERDFLVQFDGGLVTAANAAAATMKLRQMANGAVYYEESGANHVARALHDAKLDALRDLIEEQSGQPLLVAVAFQHDAVRIREFLGDSSIPYLGGGMTSRYADETIARWNRGDLSVLLAHPASVAHGLNLQSGGHSLCWFGLTWSLEDFIQMNARIWRQGQTNACVFHFIVARDTIDEAVLSALSSKDARQESLFSTLKTYAEEKRHDQESR